MAEEKAKQLPSFEMGPEDKAILHKLTREVLRDWPGKWSQDHMAILARRFLAAKGIKVSDDQAKWFMPFAKIMGNSSALRQAVFEAKAKKAQLAEDYGSYA